MKTTENEDYVNWLHDFVRHPKYESIFYDTHTFDMLFNYLDKIDFRYSIMRDANRANDGLYLRRDYAERFGSPKPEETKCSVLEMLVALSIRCENELMHDDEYGDRTYVWFWDILKNLGIEMMSDDVFLVSEEHVRNSIDIFLDRKYRRDGSGGPFICRNPVKDMRKVELWYQLNWYLNDIYS